MTGPRHQVQRVGRGLLRRARRLTRAGTRTAAGAEQRVRDRVTRAGERLDRRIEQVRERELAQARRRHVPQFVIVAPDAAEPPGPGEGWRRQQVGGYLYVTHPDTTITVADGVVVIGQPVDITAGTTDAAAITRTLAARWQPLASMPPEEAFGAMGRSVTDLAGRWVILLHHDDARAAAGALTVVPDATASVPVHWAPSVRVLASEAVLPRGAGLLRQPADEWWRLVPEGPGSGPRLEVGPLVDDESAQAGPGDEHRDAVDFEAFRERLTEHVRLLTALGAPVLNLSDGVWSRAVLAAYAAHRRAEEVGVSTYDPESARTSTGPADDLFAASDLAFRLGLPHRVLRTAEELEHLVGPGSVELRATLSGAPSVTATHPVLLPLNDRALWRAWHAQPAEDRAGLTWLHRLVEERQACAAR